MPDSDPASPDFIKERRFHSAIATCSKNERIKYGMMHFLDSLTLEGF